MTTTNRPVYLIRLQAQPSDIPVSVRLRRLLKYALRATGFKCLELVQVGETEETAGAHMERRPASPTSAAESTRSPPPPQDSY